MIRSMNYDVNPMDVINNPLFPERLDRMKKAGVDSLWLAGFMYGRPASDEETLLQAKKRLEEEGLRVGVISLPVGHPGNSLNPDDPTLDLSIAPSWRYRVNKNGEKEYFCACIEENMLEDNRKTAEIYAQMGFQRHFFDDDLRLGNWGEEVRGCFCDHCIREFNERQGLFLSREQIKNACEGKAGMEEIKEAWIQYNCDKLTNFMKVTRMPGMQSGIMVMHNGDRRHGISIPDIKKAVPDCMFRVGELHFDDQRYTAPGGQDSLAASVRAHLALIGENEAYSESTVFPAAALSPENLLHKIHLELSLGLRNIFLMSGSWFLSEPYWEMLAREKDALREYAAMLDNK